ncbi:MAG: hypothetical protein NT094_00475 [Candidatus Staskawiczbacteria bacterium]|nr:hypothetical protein [Candidatus Staskawiczbacteria bacterium]
MSIKTKILSIVLGLALVAMIVPVGASATGLTPANISAIIALLSSFGADSATIANVTASLNGTTPPAPPASGTGNCTVGMFTRTLTVGMVGSDVKCLQTILNRSASTQVQLSGAGSPGMETTYFGQGTLVAVRKYQVSLGYTPANQVGQLTRAALNLAIGTTGPGPIIPTGAGLAVQLASDNPAAGSVLSGTNSGQSQAKLEKITFVNGDNAAVKVTTLRLARTGVTSDSALNAVYLFNGATRLTDAAAVSAGVISFNDSTGLFTVPAGSSITITVAADMVNGLTGGTVGVSLNASTDVVTNASSVRGYFPLTGNLMSVVNSGTNLATAYFNTNYNGDSVYDVSPSGASIDPQTDYPVWYTNLNVSISSGTVKLNRLALNEVGSINYSDIQNFRLYVDGVQQGSAVANLDSNGYLTFNLSSAPISLQSGARQLKVLADIIGGSSRTFSMQLKTAADVTLTDSQYGVNFVPTISNGSSTTVAFAALRSCYTLGTTTYGCTINSGANTSSKTTDSPSGNVVNGASSQVLARYTLKANGERVKVDNLKVYAAFSNTTGTSGSVAGDCTTTGTTCVGGGASWPTLRNAALYANGVQIGNTFNLSTSSANPNTVSLGSSLIIDPSTPVTLELRADIYDNAGSINDVDATDTITAYLVAGSGNGMGQVSSASVSVPTAAIAGNALTVAAGGLTLSKYTAYTNQTVVVPVTAMKLGHFTLTAGTTEAVNLSTIGVSTTTLATYTTNLYVKIGTLTTSSKTSLAADSAANATTGANTWAINYSIPAGQTVDVMVYGDVNSLKPAGTSGTVSVAVSGTTASSATAACAGYTSVCSTAYTLAGQTITFGAGSMTATIDGTTPVEGVIAGNQSIIGAKFKVTASNDSYTITEAKVNIASNGDMVVQNAILTDGTNSYTATFNGTTFYFTGMNVPVAANTTKVLTANLLLSTPITDGTTITTGKAVTLTLYGLKALNSQGVVKADGTGIAGSGITLTSGAGSALYVYKTVPTFTVGTVAGQSTNLSSGSQATLYNFTVGADAKGPVALKQIKFTTTITSARSGYPTLDTFKFFRGSTDITGSVRIQTAAGVTLEDSTTSIATGAARTVVVTFNTEETISAGAINAYTLKASPTGFAYSSTYGGDSASTKILVDAASTTNQYLYGASDTAVQQLQTKTGTPVSTYNVIWSDNSASGTDAYSSVIGHDYTATTGVASSSDWFSAFDILNLPLDPIGVSVTQ